jgi:hypothetical protein
MACAATIIPFTPIVPPAQAVACQLCAGTPATKVAAPVILQVHLRAGAEGRAFGGYGSSRQTSHVRGFSCTARTIDASIRRTRVSVGSGFRAGPFGCRGTGPAEAGHCRDGGFAVP